MKDDTLGLAVGAAFIFGMLSGFFISAGVIDHSKRQQIQSEAIRAHVAEYYLDQNNERKFRWKECK